MSGLEEWKTLQNPLPFWQEELELRRKELLKDYSFIL